MTCLKTDDSFVNSNGSKTLRDDPNASKQSIYTIKTIKNYNHDNIKI